MPCKYDVIKTKTKLRIRLLRSSMNNYSCRAAGWGMREAGWTLVGSMNEESQVRGCYNITFICTPTRKQTLLEKTENKTFRT